MTSRIHTKKCLKCGLIKSINNFYFRSDRQIFRTECKTCFNYKIKQNRLNNLLKYKEKDRLKYLKNKTTVLFHAKQWQLNNPEKRKIIKQRWKRNNRFAINIYQNNRRKKDLNWRIRCNYAGRIHSALKRNQKSGHTLELLGCTIEQFKQHLESQFTKRMNWDNYGKKEKQWSVDHIIPCAVFDLTDPVEQKQCFHYSNCRPMWHIENIKKSDKILF